MLFSSRAMIFGLATFFFMAVTATSLSADQVVSEINVLTAKTQEIQKLASSINNFNAPLVVIGLGPIPKIVLGFTELSTATSTCVRNIDDSGPFTTDDDVDKVYGAITLISAYDTLEAKVPLIVGLLPVIGKRMVQALTSTGEAIDVFEDKTFVLIPSKIGDITVAEKKVDVQLEKAAKAYGGTAGT